MEASASQLDPAAAREKLLEKVKEDKAKMGDYDRRIKDQTQENERLRKMSSELSHDLEERKGDNSDSQKYEVLFQRDQEMTAFIGKVRGGGGGGEEGRGEERPAVTRRGDFMKDTVCISVGVRGRLPTMYYTHTLTMHR